MVQELEKQGERTAETWLYDLVILIIVYSPNDSIDPFTRPFYTERKEYAVEPSFLHHTSLTTTAPTVVNVAEAELQAQFKTIRTLAEQASKQPYYKWNNMWTRTMQDVVCKWQTHTSYGIC